jgi:hypothetical protein
MKKVLVTIKGRDCFIGTVIGETTTHYKVRWGKLGEGETHGEEWFAKQSKMVNCD